MRRPSPLRPVGRGACPSPPGREAPGLFPAVQQEPAQQTPFTRGRIEPLSLSFRLLSLRPVWDCIFGGEQ